MEFAIRVVDKDGDGISDIRVTVSFYSMGGWLEEFTDDDGWAEFESAGNHVGCKVFLAGESYGEVGLEDGDTFSFTLEDD